MEVDILGGSGSWSRDPGSGPVGVEPFGLGRRIEGVGLGSQDPRILVKMVYILYARARVLGSQLTFLYQKGTFRRLRSIGETPFSEVVA